MTTSDDTLELEEGDVYIQGGQYFKVIEVWRALIKNGVLIRGHYYSERTEPVDDVVYNFDEKDKENYE